jgi:hypothetical protein
LTIDEVEAVDAATLKAWIEPIAESVGAQVLVTDDADGFKSAADELGLLHRVCKSHVKRNTQALIEDLRPLVAKDSDGSLKASGVASTQAVADLDRLAELISSRQPEQGCELEEMHHRYYSGLRMASSVDCLIRYTCRLPGLGRRMACSEPLVIQRLTVVTSTRSCRATSSTVKRSS